MPNSLLDALPSIALNGHRKTGRVWAGLARRYYVGLRGYQRAGIR